MSKKQTQPKKQFYVCDKKTNGIWFTCDTWEEAREWIEIAPIKAGEPKNKFYIRKLKNKRPEKRFIIHDETSEKHLEISERNKPTREVRDRLSD